MKIKKVLFTLLLFLFFIPIVKGAETCDEGALSIESATVINQTGNVINIKDPVIVGDKIDLDLTFTNVGDSLSYEMLVKNNTNEDIELDKDGFVTSSAYIEFEIDPEDGSYVVKGNSTKKMILSAVYVSPIPANAFVNGKYVDKPNIVLNVKNDVVNPNTLVGSIVIGAMVLLLISLVALIVLRKKLLVRAIPVILVALFVIPLTVYALCKASITIVPNVNVLRNYNPCTYDGELVQGALYENGQYTYKYKQQASFSSLPEYWDNIEEDGWGVMLTDKESTDPVTTKLCTSINGKPIVSMANIFNNVHASSFDLSSFDTSNVTNMYGMFMYGFNDYQYELDFSSFDTSNVTDMRAMFYENYSMVELDLSSFNTSKVTDMEGMFAYDRNITKLDVSSFDTSNVTNMGLLFMGCRGLTKLDLSNFNTSKVENMNEMFEDTSLDELDLSSFDTSKVTSTYYMFSYAAATKGYARTQADADKFNSSDNKPSTLTFVVK